MQQLNINQEDDREEHGEMPEKKNWFYPFPIIAILLVIGIDQISKFWIEQRLDEFTNENGVIRLLNGFLWIIKVYNKGIAFSLAADSSWIIRFVVVYAIPVLLIIFLLKIIFYSDFPRRSRWFISLIAGGGLGNLVDRVFREEGVLDFISVNTYNIFNITRWPIFNFADIAVIIGMALWFIITISTRRKERKRLEEERKREELSSAESMQDSTEGM